MKAAGLTRHYPTLTEAERLALLLAAQARGDDIEADRLLSTAPRVAYRVPHTFGRLLALHEVMSYHRMQHLDLAATFLWTFAMADADDAAAERFLDVAGRFGYLLNAHAGGWARFRDWLGIDTSALESSLPGSDTIAQAAELSATFAATEAEVLDWARERNPSVQIRTAETTAAELRAMYEAVVSYWK
jgi:hypothetical protein